MKNYIKWVLKTFGNIPKQRFKILYTCSIWLSMSVSPLYISKGGVTDYINRENSRGDLLLACGYVHGLPETENRC